MYKEIKNYLIEMTIERDELLKDLRIATKQINNHLLRCLLIQNDTNNLNLWEKEIYSFLFDVPKLKGKNKIPDRKLLTRGTLNYFEDTLLNYLDNLIISMNDIESTNITEYDKQALYNCIIDYYKWLIPNLADTGSVSIISVKQEINNLIQKYNQLTKDKNKVGV